MTAIALCIRSPQKVSRDALMAEAITMASVNGHPVLDQSLPLFLTHAHADATLSDTATIQHSVFCDSWVLPSETMRRRHC